MQNKTGHSTTPKEKHEGGEKTTKVWRHAATQQDKGRQEVHNAEKEGVNVTLLLATSACHWWFRADISIPPWDQTDTVQMIISPSLLFTSIQQCLPSNFALGSYWMRHLTLILLRLCSVLSVNYLICRRIRCCLPKPAEIEINAPGALVVMPIGRAFPALSVKRFSLWNLSSSKRDFFFFSF